MSSPPDVSQLAVRRRAEAGPSLGPPRSLLARYLVPGAVVLGFLALLAWSARQRLLPSRPVTVMPVIGRKTAAQRPGEVLFTAAGWVEPRPTPVLVPALAEGIVERLLVVEDQAVEAGEPIAVLIDADARLALQHAEAERKIREAELDSAVAAHLAAQRSLEHPVHLESSLAEAESLLAKAETELAGLPFQLRAAEARANLAAQDLRRKQDAAQAVAARDIDRAKAEWEAAQAELEELRSRGPQLENQRDALARKRAALRTQLELKTVENRDLAEAAAKLKAARARFQQADAAVQTAQLRLERMTVRAPVAGRVLELMARPGSRVADASARLGHEPTTVVTLYDPRMLQVRADVRLEDLGRVAPGQAVRIETAAVGRELEGRVLYCTSVADIQKNTLQVKVALDHAPAVLKPEMLVQVRFLAPPAAGADRPAQQLRLFVPRPLIVRADGEAYVWVADQAAGRARRQYVKTTTLAHGELVEVAEGLDLASRLIVAGRDGLEDGQRITVTGEDDTLGFDDTAADGR